MSTPGPSQGAQHRSARIHVPSLAAALLIMFAGTLYPPMMADASGKADHTLALALFWAMSSGFVRGVGFVPQHRAWQFLFSGWTCSAALLLALALKLQQTAS